MRVQKEHDAVRLWIYFILAEPAESGYSSDRYQEVLMREHSKEQFSIHRARMLDAFIKSLQRGWEDFFDVGGGNPAGFDGEALILLALDYYKKLDTAEGYRNCALLRRVLQYYRKKYRRFLPPLSRNRQKLERVKKEYLLRYLN